MLQQPCWWTRTKEFPSTEDYTIFCGNSSKNVYYFVHYAGLVVTWLETKNFSTCHRVKHMKTTEDRPLKYKYGFTGADPGTFGWGGPNVGSEWLLNLFWPAEKAETTTCFSICEHLSRLVQEILLCEQRQTDHEDTQKQLHFWIALGFSFVAKCNLRFIKKISQLESDIWSCQCKSFSFKQASDLIGGSGPPPWIRQSFLFTLLPSRMCVM